MKINQILESRDMCNVCGQTPCNCTYVMEDAEPIDREFALVKKLGRLGERVVQNPRLWDRYNEAIDNENIDWIIGLIQDGTGATADEVLKLADLFGEIGGGLGRLTDFAWAVKEGTWDKDFMNPYRQHRSQGLNEFAPAGSGKPPHGPKTPGRDPWGGDDGGEDPYKYPQPEHYSRSIDFFGRFEADHFDDEVFDDATGEFRGYWDDEEGRDQIAYFKFDNPQRTGDDDPGMGWYYEPQNESINEFAPGARDDNGDNDDALFRFAKMWYSAPDVATQQRVEQALAKIGWEIGELESEEGGAFVMRIGDDAGDSYIGWSEEDLAGLDEAKKKKKSSRSLRGYFFPGYAYYGSGESGEGSGDGGGESINRGVAEMDSQGYTGSRDRKKTSKYGSRDHYELGGPESTGRPLTAKQMMDKAHKAMLKSMSNDEKVDKGWRNPNIDEGAGSIGNAIKSLYQKIYAAGDDEIEYFYQDSPIFAQYWDEYEGDLDSIIAEVDPGELQVILDELESYVQNANLAEGWTKLPNGNYRNMHTGVVSSRLPAKKKRGEKTGAEWDAIEKAKKDKEQDVAEGLGDTQKKIEDTINKLEDRLKHAKSDEQWDRISARIERLRAGLNRSKQGVAEGDKKSEPPEADYGADYQDMVARVKKLAGLGPLKTVYDPNKRVYKNIPTAVQPAQKK